MDGLVVMGIIGLIIYLVVVSGSDPKRDQARTKLRRQAVKHYNEQRS